MVGHPHTCPVAGAVIVPSASVPFTTPPAGAAPNRVTPTGPLTPGVPQWMCAATALFRLATLILYSSAAPSSRSLNFATPTAWVSRAGTSLPPDRLATKLSPAEADGAKASSASPSVRIGTIILRMVPSLRCVVLPGDLVGSRPVSLPTACVSHRPCQCSQIAKNDDVS